MIVDASRGVFQLCVFAFPNGYIGLTNEPDKPNRLFKLCLKT